ncbi:MAG: hypothetical protein LBU55_04245 [Elusimicrobiota bacterium]|jgi:cell division protein FtsB|nr:hypothetical protein [Elusimicrobiota bacterium]
MKKKNKIPLNRAFVYIAVLAILLPVKSIRISVFNYITQIKLKKNIEIAKQQNEIYKKKLNDIKTDPDVFEKSVREELEFVLNGEIEYRFKVNKSE